MMVVVVVAAVKVSAYKPTNPSACQDLVTPSLPHPPVYPEYDFTG